MATFTINETNEIVEFATPEEASAAVQTPLDSFTSEQELAELAAGWAAERLLAILNSLPGEKPAKKLKDKTAISRIWARIQGLGDVGEAEGCHAGQSWRKVREGRAGQGQNDQEVREGGSRRTARRFQDGPSHRAAATVQGRQHYGDHGQDGVAAPHRQGLHGGRDVEGWLHRRALQTGGWEAYLPVMWCTT